VTLDDIKDRCHIDDDGHWIWKGALSDGKWPRIWAPDHTKEGSPMATQTGRRAVWHVSTGKAIPTRWRVFGTCEVDRCLNPAHMKCGTTEAWGAQLQKSGIYAGSIRRQAAARQTGRKRSVLTPETYMEIMGSNETGRALAARLEVSEQTVSKVRNGHLVCFDAAGGLFTGLMAANDSGRKRA
jgi:hypothetical protein